MIAGLDGSLSLVVDANTGFARIPAPVAMERTSFDYHYHQLVFVVVGSTLES